ncbi:hypothetical protein Acsp06_44370 [Actinomycetospora sp. NBRC 106375]|nr:hypothetical protein Acsp06_44370 [Actinomycetospora sp. NBRC 106375]
MIGAGAGRDAAARSRHEGGRARRGDLQAENLELGEACRNGGWARHGCDAGGSRAEASGAGPPPRRHEDQDEQEHDRRGQCGEAEVEHRRGVLVTAAGVLVQRGGRRCAVVTRVRDVDDGAGRRRIRCGVLVGADHVVHEDDSERDHEQRETPWPHGARASRRTP